MAVMIFSFEVDGNGRLCSCYVTKACIGNSLEQLADVRCRSALSYVERSE